MAGSLALPSRPYAAASEDCARAVRLAAEQSRAELREAFSEQRRALEAVLDQRAREQCRALEAVLDQRANPLRRELVSSAQFACMLIGPFVFSGLVILAVALDKR